MYLIGAGSAYLTQLYDGSGNPVLNPTPTMLGFSTQQDMSVSDKMKIETIRGPYKFAIAAAQSSGDLEIDINFTAINLDMINKVFRGQTTTAGLTAIYEDPVGQAVAATITLTPPNSGAWSYDLGVWKADGTQMKRVASSPAVGEYSCAAGVYTFNATDVTAGFTIYIRYCYTATSTTAQRATVINTPVGITSYSQLDLLQYDNLGRLWHRKYYKVVCGEFIRKTKQDSFAQCSCKFMAFQNSGSDLRLFDENFSTNIA